MNKKQIPFILACLALDGVTASADGAVSLTPEQMNAIEAKFGELSNQLAQLQSEKESLASSNAELEAKVKALGTEDGSSTNQAGLNDTAPEMDVQARYEAIRGIL